MDLSLIIENNRLNIRAAAVIIHNQKLLIEKNSNRSHFCLPGGRIQIGEDSMQTVKRELQEELGKEVEIQYPMSVVENFFDIDNMKCHEIFFIHKAEFIAEDDKKIDYCLQNVEGKTHIQYEWVDLNRLDEYNILPKCVKDIAKSPNFPAHVIYRDEKI